MGTGEGRYKHAERRIKEARSDGSSELTLVGLGLTTLPKEIGLLTELRTLNLFSNQFTTLPPEIGSLTKLEKLDLFNNEISSLPTQIGFLSELRKLNVGGNRLGSLPREIGSLTALRELNVRDNRLSVLPPEIGSLTELQELNLAGNRLTTLPPEVGSLGALRELNLSDNRLTALPPEIDRLAGLTGLFLHENPELGIPLEILGPAWVRVITTKVQAKPPHAILEYYFRIRSAGEALQECKLIVVGRGGAGKTTLIRRLDRRPRDPQERQTHGITITRLKFPCSSGEVKARVWDFGGQVVLHSMHEFFLTARSLYLLVLGERDDMLERDAEYWLQLIRSYAGDVPVVVALNKSEGRQRQFDRDTLERNYPPILGWIATECAEPGEGPAGIDALRRALTVALDSPHMDSVRRKFPRQWTEIKGALEDMPASYLDYPQYQALCAARGITDPKEQDTLSADLHDLGVALNYGHDPRLRETSVLRPDWLANGIYAVLRGNDLDDALPPALNRRLAPDGQVTVHVLEQVYAKAAAWGMLKAADYPLEKRRFLLQLMRAFHLGYPLDDEGNAYLVPTLLPLNPPAGADEPGGPEVIRLRYEFQVVPAPLLPSFIARTFALIPDSLHWRRGAVVAFGDSRARVWTTQDERYVFVTAAGAADDRDQLVMMIRGTFKSLFAVYRGLRVVEQHDYNGSWVPRAALERMGLLQAEPVASGDGSPEALLDALDGREEGGR